MVNSKYKPRI